MGSNPAVSNFEISIFLSFGFIILTRSVFTHSLNFERDFNFQHTLILEMKDGLSVWYTFESMFPARRIVADTIFEKSLVPERKTAANQRTAKYFCQKAM